MTYKRQLPEQIASHTYRRQSREESSRAQEKREQRRLEAREEEQGQSNAGQRDLAPGTRPRQRVVTPVPPTDPSTAWNAFAQRQERRRRAAARARMTSHARLEARTYARTGSWASGGRTRNIRRPLPRRRSTIPTRSGRYGPRRGWFWRVLGVLAGLIGLGLATNFVFTSNAFRIEQVNVTGTQNDALIHTIQRMGRQGENIFLVNVPSLKERVEALPLVASADVSKQWPNQLTVAVTERRPALLWQTPQGTYSVDSQGVVIAPASQTPGADHLKIVVAGMNATGKEQGKAGSTPYSTIQPLRVGMHLNAGDIAFAISVFKQLPQLTGVNTFKLRYDGTMYPDTTGGQKTPGSRGSFVVESPDGWIAYLGSAADANPLENRLIALQQILALGKQQGERIATVDVRYGLHPVYTLKS